MKRKNLLVAVILGLSLVLSIAGCKKDDVKPDEQKVENPVETYTESNLYIGVVGFNDHLNFMGTSNRHFYPISSSSDIEWFISNLSMANGTLLYYSVDSSIKFLEKVQFPNDVETVSLITFTDGLDQGSGVMNPNYSSASSYLDAVNNKIRNVRVNGRSINAYSIGIVGSDVTDKTQFVANLNKLASSPQNVTEVTDMSAVQNRFKKLAYEIKSILQSETTLKITTPYTGTKIRFTFDDVNNATNSKSYLEGIYKDGSLSDIKYIGCSAANGSSVNAKQNGIHSSLSFVSLKGYQGAEVDPHMVQQWEYVPSISGWQINSEFEQKFETTYSKSSVIMLVLDCSSSLSDKFPYMKQSVVEFLNILNGTFNDGTSEETGNTEPIMGTIAIENGAIKASYSVSPTRKVYFSQGNLQYRASTNTWKFADNQYDIIGDDNANISSSYSGWIDLFGWGTSGWNSGANAYQPYSTSKEISDYYLGGSYPNNNLTLTGSYANADWGVYNKISNGGNQAGQWRTLTEEEWDYVITGRANANRLIGQGSVNNVNGLILLPDGWETPSSVKFTYDPGNYSTNVYSQDEWAVMESYGAVFLPAAGYRFGTNVHSVGYSGEYWSSSVSNEYYGMNACYLGFFSEKVYTQEYRYYDGRSVRLVRGL